MSSFDYAIVIPAWNEAEFIEASIAAAQTAMQCQTCHGQLIVVDNNSSDDTAALARAAGATVVFEPINQISRSRNAGANASDADMLIFLDADTELSATLLSRAIALLQTNEIVGGGAPVAPDRVVPWHAQWVMTGWNCVSRLFKLAAGCFIFCRADAFNQIGGFTVERFAGEELVLSRQLRRWGRQHNMAFHIIQEPAITTSVRKIDWFTAGQLFRQYLFALVPGALKSKKAMRTWYDETTKRSNKE